MRQDVPLAPFTTWRVGGPARYFLEPATEEELVEALAWANAQGLPWQVIGRGSNLLVADSGFDGLVIRLAEKFGSIQLQGDRLIAQAGASLSALVKFGSTQNLGGAEFFATIPGSVGGAVTMNAGAHEGTTSDWLTEVRLLSPAGRITVHDPAELHYGYRHSDVRETGAIVLGATFRFRETPGEQVQARVSELLKWRKAHQPVGASAGSVFRNPPASSAGRLIDAAQAKGMIEGRAQVSPAHGNFIVNLGGATADQITRLIARVQDLVFERHQVWLRPEVVGVGLKVGQGIPVES